MKVGGSVVYGEGGMGRFCWDSEMRVLVFRIPNVTSNKALFTV